MGMDVYGLNPRESEGKPTEPSENATQDELQQYYQALHDWNKKQPGRYFRSNFWNWFGIISVAEMSIQLLRLPLSTRGWGANNGDGLQKQEDCDMLAYAIETFLLLNQDIKESDDTIYVVTSMWTDSNGSFLSQEKSLELSLTYEPGSILYNHVVMEDGTIACPACGTTRNHIENFVKFLRSCGGFEIC